MERRRFIKNMLTGAAGAYGLTHVPEAFNWAVDARRASRVGPGKFLKYVQDSAMPPVMANDEVVVNAGGKITDHMKFWIVAKALLKTIGDCEGTYHNPYGMNPYKIIYTYDTFEDMSDHPRRAYPIPGTNSVSDAAGWLQVISPTYDALKKKHDFWFPGPAFSEINQDLICLYLLDDEGVLEDFMQGIKVDENDHISVPYAAFAKMMNGANWQWASFPVVTQKSNGMYDDLTITSRIGDATGQKAHSLREIWTKFNWYLYEHAGYRRNIQHPVGLEYKMTSPMGMRWGGEMHGGMDFGTPIGTPLVAPENGTITRTGTDSRSGEYSVFVPDGYPEFELVSCHLKVGSMVPGGTKVKRGEVMALTGNTGRTTGPHVHFGTWIDGYLVNPKYYLGMAEWF